MLLSPSMYIGTGGSSTNHRPKKNVDTSASSGLHGLRSTVSLGMKDPLDLWTIATALLKGLAALSTFIFRAPDGGVNQWWAI